MIATNTTIDKQTIEDRLRERDFAAGRQRAWENAGKAADRGLCPQCAAAHQRLVVLRSRDFDGVWTEGLLQGYAEIATHTHICVWESNVARVAADKPIGKYPGVVRRARI